MSDLGTAPRWFLALALAVTLAVLGWGAARWVAMVESHVNESSTGYQRIAVLEARVAVLEARATACERRHKDDDRR